LQAADLPEVLRIEQEALPDPWNEGQLAGEMQVNNGVSVVAEQDGRVCGYAFFRTCTPESELLRLAVAREWRRQGVGNTLLEQALHRFSKQGYATCFLEVRSSNEAARRLYLKAGFLEVGLRKKYYSQPIEDAVQLCRNLTDMKGGNP
jgi:ribosomal-protein-alanine N-acetyltransferase